MVLETCAFDINRIHRDIAPGEIIIIDKKGLRSIKDNCTGDCKYVCWEYVYFARTDSIIEGASVYEARKKQEEYLQRTCR